MSGSHRFVLDTNAVVSLLAGNRELAKHLESAEYVGISIISYLEFLAFDGLSDNDRDCFASLCKRVDVVPLLHDDIKLTQMALDLRRKHRMKLPDAIIGATALSRKATLITNDTHFCNIDTLTIQGC
jgi:tRNA(fMet)-specific endonuclease VapC